MPSKSYDFATKEVPLEHLMRVALGEMDADLAIVGGDVVNVYTGEVVSGDTVLVKGNRRA
jgi:adenine deaminase